MRVLAINGSPNERGTTYAAMRTVTDELEKQGVEIDFVNLGQQSVHGCTGCGSCRKHPENLCIFDDDAVNACLRKVNDIDGLLIGSPVYYSGVAGNMKSFLDRFFFTGPSLRFKVGAAVCAVRRSGGVPTFHQLNNYLNLGGMIIAPTHYWNVAHGNNSAQDVEQDLEGAQVMRMLGQNMAWLLKAVELAKVSVPLPERERRVFTNFIR